MDPTNVYHPFRLPFEIRFGAFDASSIVAQHALKQIGTHESRAWTDIPRQAYSGCAVVRTNADLVTEGAKIYGKRTYVVSSQEGARRTHNG